MRKLILIFLIVPFLFNCGARKAETTKEDIKIKNDIEVVNETAKKEVVETKEDVNTNINIVETESETTITPVNADKEMVVDGKTYKNAVLSNKKRDSNTHTSKDEKKETKASAETNVKDVKKDKGEVNVKSKSHKVDRKESFTGVLFWIFWILLLIAVFFIVRWLNKKYPNLFWFV